MLSVSIKNSIIFLLLIVLIHKLLTTVLQDQRLNSTAPTKVSRPRIVLDMVTSDEPPAQPPGSQPQSPLRSTEQLPESTQLPLQPPPPQQLHAGESSSSSPSSPPSPHADDIPKDLLDYVYGSSSSTSQPHTQSEAQTQPRPKQTRPQVGTHDGPHMIISQYDNEKCINGGEVCPGIFAFDQSSMSMFSMCTTVQ